MLITYTAGDLADIEVLGFGHIYVNNTERTLHPVHLGCSQQILHAMWCRGESRLVAATLDAVEVLASTIFPPGTWSWGIHDTEPPVITN